MNWVSPIKDEKTLETFKENLKNVDDKYYIMFEIGIGTGMQLQDILKLKIKDVRGKDSITCAIGSKSVERTFDIPADLKAIIEQFCANKADDEYLIKGHNSSSQALSREQAYRVFKSVGKNMGLNSIGAQTMRKTFAWKYYKEHNDIYYLQHLFNHASPSITYRFIGEKPNVQLVFKKLTPEENERSRRLLYTDNNGKNRIDALVDTLTTIRKELDDPMNNDAFYGKVDTLLVELEEIMDSYKESK